MHTTTVGAFARRLLTVAELDLYGTPLPPVGPILEYRFSVHLAAHADVAKRAVLNKPRLPLAVGASGFLCALVLRPRSLDCRWFSHGAVLDPYEVKRYYGHKRFKVVTESVAHAEGIRKVMEQAGVLGV